MSYSICRCTESVVCSQFQTASLVFVRPILFYISYIASLGNRVFLDKLDKTLVVITTKIPQLFLFQSSLVIWIFAKIIIK